jgi:hypothetical protein
LINLEALLAPIDDHAANRSVGLHGNFSVLQAACLHHLKAHSLDCRDDLVEANAFEILSVEGRRGEEEGKALKKVHFQELPSG